MQGPPTLLHVALLVNDTVRVAPTLAELAGAAPPSTSVLPATTAADVRTRAATLYARMRDALRRGDWAAFGQAFDELGKLLAPGGAR